MGVSYYKNNVPPLQWVVSNDPARAKGLKQVVSFGVIHPIRIIVSSRKQKGFYEREVGVINGMEQVGVRLPVGPPQSELNPEWMHFGIGFLCRWSRKTSELTLVLY